MELFRSMLGRGGRRGRGDVRAAILLLLAEQPCNGYQLMQEIERRSDGAWRPSSGSVYPALQQLEDERLVTVDVSTGGKLYKLTARGTEYVAAHREELGTPWKSEATDPRWDMMTVMAQIAPALQQVVRFGTPAQVAEARKVVVEAKRALYRILAETGADDGDGADGDGPDGPDGDD
jgi:DNA-binding PadR family transcriptional regulator